MSLGQSGSSLRLKVISAVRTVLEILLLISLFWKYSQWSLAFEKNIKYNLKSENRGLILTLMAIKQYLFGAVSFTVD